MGVSFRIESVFLFIAIDGNGSEGVAAAAIGPNKSWVPLIAADEARLKALVPVAKEIADQTHCKIKLIKMTTREDIMDIGDEQTSH
jgi:hypothetical protein